MPILNSPEYFYLKLNLLLILALVLWVVLAYCGRVLSIRASNKAKLSTARWLLLCTLVFPLMIYCLSIILPGNNLADFYYQKITNSTGLSHVVSDAVTKLPESVSLLSISKDKASFIQKLNLPSVFWLLIAMGMLWRSAITLREIAAFKRLINRSQALKQIGSLRLLFSDEVNIPLATRLIGKSYIIIPSDMLLSSKVISMVLRHEGQHLRNGDLWWSWLLECLSICCFWNPAVRGWRVILHNLQEYACDETLLASKQISEKDYGQCLIQVAETAVQRHYAFSASMSIMTLGFNSSASLLKRRLAMLQETVTPLSNVIHFISRILLLGVTGFYAAVSFGEAPVLKTINPDLQRIEPARIIPALEQPKPESTAIKAANGTSPVTRPSNTPQTSVIPGPTRTKTVIVKTGKTTYVSAIKMQQPAQKQLSTPALQNNLMVTADKIEQPVNIDGNSIASPKQVDQKNVPVATGQMAGVNADSKVCRHIKIPGIKGERKVCGTQGDWQAYERRKALIKPGMTCRMVKNWQTKETKQYCATAGQWAEFERQVALNKKREICRPIVMGSARKRCMTAEQWKVYDRRVRNYAETQNMGREQREAAAFTTNQYLVNSLVPIR